VIVDVLLKPTGDAPIMKKRKWTVERTKKISSVIDFVRKYLKFEPHESLVSSYRFSVSVLYEHIDMQWYKNASCTIITIKKNINAKKMSCNKSDLRYSRF